MSQLHLKVKEISRKFLQDHEELTSIEQLGLLEVIKQQIIQKVRQTSAITKCKKCGFDESEVCSGCGKPDPQGNYIILEHGYCLCLQCETISSSLYERLCREIICDCNK
jgi:hypothetical protein